MIPLSAFAESKSTNAHTEEHHEHTLYGETLFQIGGVSISNALVTSWIAFIVIFAIGITVIRNLKTIPGKLQNIFEILIENFLDIHDMVTNDRDLSVKILPFTFSLFCFVLINNWLGIIPGVGSLFIQTANGSVALLRGSTADINTTLALGVVGVVGANIVGITVVGISNTVTKYIALPELLRFKNIFKDPSLIIQIPVNIFIGLMELIGELSKVASLSFRLFGNIFAGEVLLASMAAIFAFMTPVPFVFLEVFVGVIQAFILSLLVIIYATIASSTHGHDESEAHGGEAHATGHTG
jgi:F-type H+-transporting ATPase subunit a